VLGANSNALWPRFGETHRALLDWLPRAEPYVLPNATHAMQLQHPHSLAVRLVEFFMQHPL
jgi:pimeloyl-ACP methyl ester carboxylesterase